MLVTSGAAAAAVLAVGVGWSYRRETRTDAHVEHGQQLQATGDSVRAEAEFRAAVAQNPDRADAWGWLACVAQDQAIARDAAQRALRLDPQEPNARVLLAYQGRDLGSWTRFEDVLIDVLRTHPANTQALNHLTFFYQGMGRCRESWTLNERAVQAEPFNPTPLHRRALKHWIFGRVGQADLVADEALRLFPRTPNVWNARMVIYAFTGRGPAGLALLDDLPSRPRNLTPPSIASWRAALQAIATRTPADVARAVAVCTKSATLSPGLAANAIMALSYLGEVDAAYRVASGLFEGRGLIVQRSRVETPDLYAPSAWGRTQFLFIPATSAFRADPRFAELCGRLGHLAYWRERGIWPDAAVRGALDPAKLS